MCGVVGAAAAVEGDLPDSATAERMCAVIKHRGPDDQGIHREPRAFLGMRRLSIIDLATGHQPIRNEDGTVWLVFNGEIYNFRELRAELEAFGHRFYTNTDSECIVHAYEQFGTGCFSRLRGMFAIAIWDAPRETLVLARDRFGKKPLYYAEGGGSIVFGSELKSLLEVPSVERRLDANAVHDFLLLGYVPSPDSILSTVKKLPPAHFLVNRGGSSRIERYWQLPFEPKWTEGESALEERLLAELDEAVRIRLVSDVPFGAFLSGGTDSSLVVALMARNLGSPVKTFSIGFREAEFSELEDARRVARHVGAEHHEMVVEPEAVGLLQELAFFFDEPLGDSSLIPTYLVSKMAAAHVKMVLSGDGGDELFGGYDRYRRFATIRALQGLPMGLGASLPALAGRVLPGPLGRRARWLSRRVRMPFPESYLSGVGLTVPALAGALLRDAGANGGYASVREHFLRADVLDPLDKVMAGDVLTYLPEDVLVKVDRASMANSLEARAPLLDHKLAEFAARLPVALKIREGRGKHLLRAVIPRLLPPECAAKRKQGFAIPLAAWFRRDLRAMAEDVVGSRSFRERGVFDPAVVRSCLDAHVSSRSDHGELLWMVLVFELWARQFLDAH